MAYDLKSKVHVLKNGSERVTSDYGNRTLKFNGKTYKNFHAGIDLISKKFGKDYIIAFADGKVVSTRSTIKGYNEQEASGNYVAIKHSNGYETRYLHLKINTIKVKVGQKVKKGQVLAYMNSSGFSTGDHLHFEVRKNGIAVDPKPFLLGEKTFSKKSLTAKNGKRYHKVLSGDTLWTIAEKYFGNGMKYKELAKLNDIQAPYIIYPGQELKLK